MKLALCTLTAIGLAGFALAAGGCKESGIDARKTADALSEEFTDGIEFENGNTQDGPPPDSTTDAPRIIGVNAPRGIGLPDDGSGDFWDYESPFTVELQADANIDGALGAIAHIVQANKTDQAGRYIRIEPPTAVAGTAMTLTATVHHFAGLGGNAFEVRFAVILADGSITPYKEWNLITYPMEGESTLVPMCPCENGEVKVLDRSACDNFLETVDPPAEWFWPEFNDTPCSLWHSYLGAMSEGFEYPSGTRFVPTFFPGDDLAACTFQFTCN